MEEGRVRDSGDVWGPETEDAPVQKTGPRYPTTEQNRERRSEAESFASKMDLRSVSEILEGSSDGIVLSSLNGEGEDTGGGLHSDDSDAGEESDVSLPEIRFVAFLGTGKTAVTIGVDGEAQINLQVHPQFLDQVIELLRRRNNVLKVTIQ